MATVTQTVRESAWFTTREPRSSFIFFMRDSAELGERTRLTPTSTIREVAVLNDVVSSYNNVVLRDTAELNDVVTRSTLVSRTLREQARVLDRAADSVRVFETVRESAAVTDNATGSVDYVLRDSANVGEIVTASTRSTRTLRETAKLGDRARPVAGLTVRESAVLNDDFAARTAARHVTRESAVLNDAAHPAVAQRNVLRETARLGDNPSIMLRRSTTLREVAYLSDAATPPAYGRAYTCSVMTWGMSTFSNYPFQTMAGNFGAGNNLWRLDAATDNGAAIPAYIRTGTLDMGKELNKRLSAVYLAGSADAPLTVEVTGDVESAKAVYSYTAELRDTEDYRNNRAIVGKGFRSRFVQVKIGATGVNYRLLSASADIAVTARRV